jgi:plastocyanin
VRALVTLIAAALLSGCATTASEPDAACTYDVAVDATTVIFESYTFIPHCFRAANGTVVTFLNLDTVPHTVTTDAGQVETFDSGSLPPGTAYTHAFGVDGDIALHCSIFPIMTAMVFVRTP